MTDKTEYLDIGYFVHSNIQHLPPVIQLYQRIGGVVITTRSSVEELLKTKYAEMRIPVYRADNLVAARKLARRLRLRLVIHPSFHLLYCGKAVQIFHGGLSDKRYLESARLTSYDLVLFPGQKAVDKVRLAGTLSWINEWQVVGYPKFDPYLNGDMPALPLFDNQRKTVLYAPTWVSEVTSMKPGQRSKHGESSLLRWSLDIIGELAATYNLIIKLHSNLQSNKLDIYEKIEQQIAQGGLADNVKVVIDDNILPYMVASDLMISDISSVCYEWLHLNRPIVFANPAPGRYTTGKHFTDNTFVWQAGTVINSVEDIFPVVAQALEFDDRKDIRHELLNYAIHQPDGQAGERQARYIMALYDKASQQNWWWLYLTSAVRLRFRRLRASFLSIIYKIPR